MPLTADDIDRLYREQARGLLRFLARRTLDAEAAVDLVAETFATAIAQRHTCAGESTDAQTAWLFGIARNLLSGWYRSGAIERRAVARLGIERPALTDQDLERIDDLAALDHLRGQVETMLDDLGDGVRRAIHLRVVEECSYRETARILQISEQTARMRVSRGLRTLAERLAGSGVCEPERVRDV